MRFERIAFSLALIAALVAFIPATALMLLGYPANSFIRWMFWAGLGSMAAGMAAGFVLRHKRLTGNVMLQDLRVGSTISRGVSPLGKTRNHLGVSPASAFIVMSALAMALGGLAFVYVNLWDY